MNENGFNCLFTQQPLECPKCSSSNLSGGSQDYIGAEYEIKEYSCLDCDFEWSETWKFEIWEPKSSEL